MSTENQILNKILQDKSLSIIFENNLERDYFPTYSSEYDFIVDHYRQYDQVPDKTTVLDHFPTFPIYEISESVDYLINSIQENYLFSKMAPVIKGAHDKSKENANEALEYMTSQVNDLQILRSAPAVDLTKEGADQRYQEYILRRDNPEKAIIPTGFKELDSIVNGWERGEELVTVLARSNQGKSWLLTTFGAYAWLANYKVGIYSGEMSTSKVGYRFDTIVGNISNKALVRGYAEEQPAYLEHITRLKNNPNSFKAVTRKELGGRATVPKLVGFIEKYELDMLIIDQFSLMDDYRARRNDDLRFQLAHISEDLFNLSCKYKIPILAASQANRAGAKKNSEDDGSPPELEHIAESDAIGQNSSKIVSMRQKDGAMEMQVRKNRESPLGEKLTYTWNIDRGEYLFVPSGNEISVTSRTVSVPSDDSTVKFKTGVEVF